MIRGSRTLRFALLAALLAAVILSHWLTPVAGFHLHAVHVALRKALLAPVLLAAVWFGMRGALYTAGAATVLYVPHVTVHWGTEPAENVSQAGEIGGLWLMAATAGFFVERVRAARRTALAKYQGRLRALIEALEGQLMARRKAYRSPTTSLDQPGDCAERNRND